MSDVDIDVLHENLKRLEESFWLEPELRSRYRHELLLLVTEYSKLSDSEFNHPLNIHCLAYISFMADRLLELTTKIKPNNARKGVLRLELEQYPLTGQKEQSLDWYRERGIEVHASQAIEQKDSESRHVLFSPKEQNNPRMPGMMIRMRQWLYSPYRSLPRVIETIRGSHG